MIVRPLQPSDVPILRGMAERSGYPYPDPLEALEIIRVVADDDNKPLAAAAGKKLVEVYFWTGSFERPHAKLHAIRLLHDTMGPELKAMGYSFVEAGLPPEIEAVFGKRLKEFGWFKNAWPSWGRRL